jgi:rhodanese-related sulfurtransferase
VPPLTGRACRLRPDPIGDHLSTKELQQRLDRDSGLHVWNVQTNQSFDGEPIPGSRRIPLDSIERDTADVSKDAAIVTYCGGPRCSQSTDAARQLLDLGYTSVHVYKEGLEGWKPAEKEIVTAQPIPAA